MRLTLDRVRWQTALVAIVVSLGAGCGGGAPAGPPAPAVTAARWPEADAIFHRDPRWLGADAAFTVALGGDRILWLFGDTFVATSPANMRAQSKLVRNTVAVQTGADPTTASITFHWGHASAAGSAPASFFADPDSAHWRWPQHGLRIGDKLVLFLNTITIATGGLGFTVAGWTMAVIDNPDDTPDQWMVRYVDPPPAAPPMVTVGAAVLADGDRINALAVREPGDHAAMLVRWPASSLAAGTWDGMEWWLTDQSWGPTGPPAIVLDDAGPECSISWADPRRQFVHVASQGFGATSVALRFADQLTGPWSAPSTVFQPPESAQPNAFVYAAKGHPELTGADLVVTYVANTMGGLKALVDDTSLYFPRFVGIYWGRP